MPELSLTRHAAPAAAAALLTAALVLSRPELLVNLDHAAQDSAVRHTATPAASARVAIVAVDEASLTEFGQWPWPRDVVGRLVTALHEGGAAAIAFDILFPEPDRMGVPSTAAGGPTSTDAELAAAIARAPVVAGFALTFEDNRLASAASGCVLTPLEPVQRQRGDADLLAGTFEGSGAVCSVSVLREAARASGAINAAPDGDGILRRVPMLVRLGGHVHPTLALAAVHAAGRPALLLEPRADDSLRLRLDDRAVVLDAQGTLLLRPRGPGNTYPHVPAADVIAGRVPPGTFNGRIVFVGATALGVRDVVATPLDARFPGVELHATVADMLLGGTAASRPEFAGAIELVAAVLAAVLSSLAVSLAGAGLGASLSVAAGAAAWGGARWLFGATGAVLSPVAVLAGLALGAAVSGAWQLARERRRADAEGRRHHEAQRLIIQTLTSLTATRDEDTGRHARRTQDYVRVLATALARQGPYRRVLTPERIDLIATLAPLHDIGKVGISDAVLNKTGHLTAVEYAEMRTHADIGHDSLLRAEHLAGVHDNEVITTAKEIVYTHHEHWDGSGYPRGLKGTAIPLPGRLVAVVDVYDALVEARAYKAAMLPERALEMIVEGRGSHFDPDIVDAFVTCFPRLAGARRADDDPATHHAGA